MEKTNIPTSETLPPYSQYPTAHINEYIQQPPVVMVNSQPYPPPQIAFIQQQPELPILVVRRRKNCTLWLKDSFYIMDIFFLLLLLLL
ncbi:hypothetical protein C1645_873726 [Glomus cerebriforme]|uniref:Uncharacterized protein n=1 Tax=Glomus cerebriforme TaxID=658196 RepID=A0A397TAP8_9GLOM|nr:hypothetical protein C1645_873726 [Glomus cerebriforme]